MQRLHTYLETTTGSHLFFVCNLKVREWTVGGLKCMFWMWIWDTSLIHIHTLLDNPLDVLSNAPWFQYEGLEVLRSGYSHAFHVKTLHLHASKESRGCVQLQLYITTKGWKLYLFKATQNLEITFHKSLRYWKEILHAY